MKKLLFIAIVLCLCSCTKPSIKIDTPENYFKTNKEYVIIKGSINPTDAELFRDNEHNRIEVKDGQFVYGFHLPDSVNELKLIVKDSHSETVEYLKVFRELSKEEQEKYSKIKQKKYLEDLAIEKKWKNSPAGKIQKKHPEWSNYDCERLANGEVWIGMSKEMLIAQRGYPDKSNESNYGNGSQWQWVWRDHSPSYFYDNNDDGLVDSYN